LDIGCQQIERLLRADNMLSVFHAGGSPHGNSDVASDIRGLNIGHWTLDCAQRNGHPQWICQVSFFMLWPARVVVILACIPMIVLAALRSRSTRNVLTAPRCHLWSIMNVWARVNHPQLYAVEACRSWWHYILVVVRLRTPFQVLGCFLRLFVLSGPVYRIIFACSSSFQAWLWTS
jgi:hypothetical protein